MRASTYDLFSIGVVVGPALRTASRLGKGPSGQVYLGSVEPPPEGTRYFQL